jgi:hypothetical protein
MGSSIGNAERSHVQVNQSIRQIVFNATSAFYQEMPSSTYFDDWYLLAATWLYTHF